MPTYNKQQQLTYVGLCPEGEALDWWKAKRHSYNTWEEVMPTLREYYGGQYKLDRTFIEISNLKQTGIVQNT